MAENLQEKLEQRIQKNEKVTASEVVDAYTQTVENRRKEYIANGGKYENFDTEEKAFLDTAKQLRDKRLNIETQLKSGKEEKKLDILAQTQDKARKESYRIARERGWAVTDPDAKGALIDDYDGTGDDNRFGFGRSALAGYLVGMQFQKPELAVKALERAKKEYEGSESPVKGGIAFGATSILGAATGGLGLIGGGLATGMFLDQYLSDDKIKEILGVENLKQLEKFDLADESKGFLASYLALADGYFQNPKEKDAYKKYFFGAVQDALRSVNHTPVYETHVAAGAGKGAGIGAAIGTFLFPVGGTFLGAAIGGAIGGNSAASSPTETYDSKNNKAKLQLDAFEKISAPKEWAEKQREELQKIFDPFKRVCDTLLAANPDLKFQDQEVKDLIGKNANELSFLDKDKIVATIEKARMEIFNYLTKKKEDFGKEIDANKKNADALQARNKALRFPAVADEEWTKFATSLKQQSDDLNAAAFLQTSSIDDLNAAWNKMVVVRNSNGLIKDKFNDLDAKTKEGEEKEPKILKFLGDKNLTENFDPSTKQFNYAIGDMRFTVEGGKGNWSYANPEIQKIFEAKVVPYFNQILAKYPLTKDEKKRVNEILDKADKKDPKAVQAATAEVMGYVSDRLKTKMKQDELDKYNKINGLMAQAQKDSAFNFDHRPSLDELQDAYTKKFVPVWEKAAADFETQVGPLTVTPDVAPVAPPDDPYQREWANGEWVSMGEDFTGYTGGLNVASEDGVNLRDLNTHKGIMNLPQGTGVNTMEITLAEPNGKALRVNNLTFVKINYRGTVYYAAKERLQRNDRMPNVKPVPVPAVPEVVAPKNVIEAAGYPYKVNGEYRSALERIAQFGDTPEGAKFDIWYNKKLVTCSVRKVGPENYLVEFPGGTIPTKSLIDAMNAFNNGNVVMQMTSNDLRTPKNYKAYEKLIDSFKKDISVSNQGEVYFELDWKGGGAGEGNAQIWVTPMTYGGIQYHIRREHAAIDGSSDRYGFAHNFDDFMKQTAHIKDWSENYEDRRDDKKLTATVKSEENFRAQINDPRNFYAFEQQIGRPVSFDIGDNGVVQMYLDWGGGPARDINNNAMLNVWVENGKLMYTLNAKGKGMVKGRQVANSMQEMIQNVTQYRMAALGAAPNSPPPVPNAPSAVPVAAPKGAPPPPKVTGSAPSGVPLAPNTGSQMEKPWPKETAEQKEERNRLADGVKKKLLLLTQDDAKLEASGQSVSKLLDESAALLQELKTKYPYDPDIFILGKAYEDLRRDFNENRETDLDQAFEPILQEMRQEIAKAGVKKISMDRLNEVQSPSLLRTVERLRGLNIQPSYVVQSQNPNAKTVVLFMQRHPEQKIANFNQEGGSQDDILRKAFEDSDREFRSLESSQGQIRDAIVAAVRSGLIHTVYEEGLPKGGQLIKLPQVPENELPSFMERMQKEDPEMARDFGAGSLQAQLILGKGLKLTGYDFDELKMKIISGKADMKYRMHAHNAFIASNLSDYVESSPDEVSFLTIGAAHEAFPSSKVAHQLPLSNAMAYYGMNVVVVDTAYSPPVS